MIRRDSSGRFIESEDFPEELKGIRGGIVYHDAAKRQRGSIMSDLETTVDNANYIPQIGADSDQKIVDLWLFGHPPTTITAYTRDIAMFRSFVAKPLHSVTLADLQEYAASLGDYAISTRARRLAAVKSLLRFAAAAGLLVANPGVALRLPTVPSGLAGRIMDEETVQRILAFLPEGRDRVLVRLLYGSGIRAAELYGLMWASCQRRGDAGQITVIGKGSKERSILLSAGVWRELLSLGQPGQLGYVFLSKRGRPLTESTVWRIVRKAAQRAGVTLAVSPHWLRHAHASHALDRGAPIHLVRDTLGHASLATTGHYTHARPGDSSGRYLPI